MGVRKTSREALELARSKTARSLHARWLPFSVVAVILLVTGCQVVWGKKEPPLKYSQWTPEAGWTAPAEKTSSPTAAAMRAEARKALESEAHKDALQGLVAMRESFPDSKEAQDAQTFFLMGECYLHLNDYEEAYENYQEVLQRNPGDEILHKALNRIYHIGLSFLHGKAKRSFAGIRYRSPTYGVEILVGEKGLVTRYLYLSYSDDALMEVARYYLEKKQYPEAEQVLERLVRDRPDSEWIEIAEFQLAVTVFNQIRGVDYDQEPLKKAKRKFELYRKHHPRGDHSTEVTDHYLKKISEMEAQHDLKVAKYYLRESRRESARYYLQSILYNNANTEAAKEARAMFSQMTELNP